MSEGTTLVTGASGFVGQHLLQRLRGRHVLGGTTSRHLSPPSTRDVTWRAVDLLDPETVA